MLDQLNDLILASKKIGELQESLDSAITSIETVKKSVTDLETKVNFLNQKVEAQDSLLSQAVDNTNSYLEKVGSSTEKFSKEVNKLSDERQKFVETLLSGAVESVSAEMEAKLKKLTDDTTEYEALRNSMTTLTTNITRLKNEILKFQTISTKIKNTDFNMSKMTKELERVAMKNMELQLRNDKMHKIVARERKWTSKRRSEA